MKVSSKASIFSAVILVATLAVPAVGQPERGIEVGQSIQPREVRTIEREKVLVPADEGTTVLLFWSTWSPRSSSAIQIWQRYAEDYKDHGITVLSVNADNQRMEEADVQKVRDYIDENQVTLPVIVDAGLELFNEIGVIVLPTTLFFKPDGTLDYKYAGLPSSAELDLKDDLEAKLGIEKEAPEDRKAATQLAYLPKNNALLFFNLGKRYHEKGSPEKAKAKYIEALQKDPDYDDPLRALESIFFDKGRTLEAEERLKVLLTSSGLEAVTARIGQGEAAETPEAVETPAEQAAAPAGTPEKKELTPMERMRLLMEKKGN